MYVSTGSGFRYGMVFHSQTVYLNLPLVATKLMAWPLPYTPPGYVPVHHHG